MSLYRALDELRIKEDKKKEYYKTPEGKAELLEAEIALLKREVKETIKQGEYMLAAGDILKGVDKMMEAKKVKVKVCLTEL